MTPKAETKSNQLVDEISILFAGNKQLDPFTLARLKREAEKVVKVEPDYGYCILGMLACLEVDAEACKKNHELSIKLSYDPAHDLIYRENYSRSLNYLGMSNEAYQEIKKALNLYENNPDLLELAINTAIESGNSSDIYRYYEVLCKILPRNENKQIIDILKVAGHFKESGINDDIASSLVKLADELVFKNKLRCGSRLFFTDESESENNIYCFIEVNADFSKVVEMNMDLCEKISKDHYFFDKNTFSISYRSWL